MRLLLVMSGMIRMLDSITQHKNSLENAEWWRKWVCRWRLRLKPAAPPDALCAPPQWRHSFIARRSPNDGSRAGWLSSLALPRRRRRDDAFDFLKRRACRPASLIFQHFPLLPPGELQANCAACVHSCRRLILSPPFISTQGAIFLKWKFRSHLNIFAVPCRERFCDLPNCFGKHLAWATPDCLFWCKRASLARWSAQNKWRSDIYYIAHNLRVSYQQKSANFCNVVAHYNNITHGCTGNFLFVQKCDFQRLLIEMLTIICAFQVYGLEVNKLLTVSASRWDACTKNLYKNSAQILTKIRVVCTTANLHSAWP
jgi:hypothetical protein